MPRTIPFADPAGAAAAPQPDADGGGLGRVQEAGRTDDHRQASFVTKGCFQHSVRDHQVMVAMNVFTPVLLSL